MTDGPAAPTSGDDAPRLAVTDLRTFVHDEGRTIHAVDGVSFSIARGETVCLVGESGSGKSLTCRSLTGLLPEPATERVGGEICFDGTRIDTQDDQALRRIRGNRIAHVFQTASRSLDPVYSVGEQLREAMSIHDSVDVPAARQSGIELLRQVGLPQASDRLDAYPHQLSGGMAQRVAIAIALAADPVLLVADEPTTSVDVTIQARLLELFDELTQGGMSLLLVTHDLRVAATVADRILVMYGGTIVERGPPEAVLSAPAHPYTQTLLESATDAADRPAIVERSNVPSDGCRFRVTCPYAVEACAAEGQPPFQYAPESVDHEVSCVHYGPDGDPSEIQSRATSTRHAPGGIDD